MQIWRGMWAMLFGLTTPALLPKGLQFSAIVIGCYFFYIIICSISNNY